jgi:hypothetical protein
VALADVYSRHSAEVSANRLAELRFSENDGLALQMTWADVRQAVDPATKKIHAAALSRFLGFIEGRLRISVPTWWQETLKGVEVHRTNEESFRDVGMLSIRQSRELGLRVQGSTVLDSDGDGVRMSVGRVSAVVPNASFERLTRRGGALKDPSQLSAVIGDKSVYIALYPDAGFPFKVHSLERMRGSVQWSADVWAAGREVALGIGSFHAVELVLTRRTLFVFGAEGDALYIEAFNADNGRNLCRFCTSFWFAGGLGPEQPIIGRLRGKSLERPTQK